MAGSLTSMGRIEVLPGSKVARAVELLRSGRYCNDGAPIAHRASAPPAAPTSMCCTPLVAAMLHEHHECVRVLADRLQSTWARDEERVTTTAPGSIASRPPSTSTEPVSHRPSPTSGLYEEPVAHGGHDSSLGWLVSHIECIDIQVDGDRAGGDSTSSRGVSMRVTMLDLIECLREAGLDDDLQSN